MPDHARARGDRQMNVVRGVTEWLQRTKLVGLALDWAEALAGAVDDPEARPAGVAEPHYRARPVQRVAGRAHTGQPRHAPVALGGVTVPLGSPRGAGRAEDRLGHGGVGAPAATRLALAAPAQPALSQPQLSFFLARQHDGLHVYTCDTCTGDLVQHCYEEELTQGV